MFRGEVWLVGLDPTIGQEMNKTRPAVIVNDDAVGILPLKIIVPVTEWKDRYGSRPWMVRLESQPNSGLTKVSAADAFQVRSVSETRLVRKLGKLSDANMEAISQALVAVLSLFGK